MKTRVVVSEKGQVTIPKRLRNRLGLGPGTVLSFEERNGKLVASRVVVEDPVGTLLGLGEKRGVDVDRWLAAARGPAKIHAGRLLARDRGFFSRRFAGLAVIDPSKP